MPCGHQYDHQPDSFWLRGQQQPQRDWSYRCRSDLQAAGHGGLRIRPPAATTFYIEVAGYVSFLIVSGPINVHITSVQINGTIPNPINTGV